jgi:MFS family permease
VFRFYLTKILSQAGITDTVTQTQVQVIINCWSFAIAIFGSFMLDILGRRKQMFIGAGGMVATLLMIGGLIKRERNPNLILSCPRLTDPPLGYGNSTHTSGIYGTIAVIFLFQGFYAFSVSPMTSLYPTEVSPFKLRTTGIAIFRMLDSGFG